jgi:SAM-dependent methyltransferase
VLGAGGGEEANWLVGEGFRVTAVEKDPARCAALAAMFENTDVDVREADIGDFGIVPQAHGIIVALAVLHFVHPRTLPALAGRISEGLAPGGLLLAQVLTDEDPSADVRRAAGSPERFQNTFPLNDSQGVIHYFGEGELAALFARLQPLLDERYRFAAERDGGYGAGEAFVALRPSRDRS